MDAANYHTKTINEIVSENYVFASILYYFGIRFFEYSNSTLEEVCKVHGISPERVIAELGKINHQDKIEQHIYKYPIDLLIEYLKHSHHIFARKKLPYLASMIHSLPNENDRYSEIISDLKLVFPLFVHDFIQHIYQEEDSFFSYSLQLHRADLKKLPLGKVFMLLENKSVTAFAAEHATQDDEMLGIRKITDNYYQDDKTPLHLKVVYGELLDFEKELSKHAFIENNVLFPKALALENKLKKVFADSIPLN